MSHRLLRFLTLLFLVVSTSTCDIAPDGLERVRAAGVLRVAVDPSFPPFESVTEEGAIVGMDIDLARAIAGRLGVQAHFVTTGYDALYDALTAGRADVIISALYPDPARSHAFVFSRPYFNAGHVLIVVDGAGVAALGDLAGRPLACVFGTTGHMEVLRRAKTLSPPPVVLTVDDPITITQLLHTEDVSAVVTDHVSALIAASEDAALRVLDPPVTDEPYVIAVRKEDASLIQAIDAAISAMAKDGTLEELTGQWMLRE